MNPEEDVNIGLCKISYSIRKLLLSLEPEVAKFADASGTPFRAKGIEERMSENLSKSINKTFDMMNNMSLVFDNVSESEQELIVKCEAISEIRAERQRQEKEQLEAKLNQAATSRSVSPSTHQETSATTNETRKKGPQSVCNGLHPSTVSSVAYRDPISAFPEYNAHLRNIYHNQTERLVDELNGFIETFP